MRRSRTLETIGEIERRLRAHASITAGLAVEAAGRRGVNRTAIESDLQSFNARASRSSFACAATAMYRTSLTIAGIELAAREHIAVEAARTAQEAVLPWAQLRCGLERRRERLAAKTSA
jgi:hypothetical protein